MDDDALIRFSRLYVVSKDKHPTLGTPCWLWTKPTPYGYGRFSVNNRMRMAHRISYEHFVGPIPKGLFIDHLCRMRACVNPGHLEPVTTLENARRGDGGSNNRRKTHCTRGHEYSDENTRIKRNLKDGSFERVCKECSSLYEKIRVARRRDVARLAATECAR